MRYIGICISVIALWAFVGCGEEDPVSSTGTDAIGAPAGKLVVSANKAGGMRSGRFAEPSLQAQEDQVREASAAWDEAFNSGDLTQLMALYTEEAVDMPPNLPVLEGRAAIEADLQYILEEFTAHHETSIIDIKIGGDLAIERAAYTMLLTPKAGGDTVTEVGKHIVVRQKVGDKWKVLWEIWNSDG